MKLEIDIKNEEKAETLIKFLKDIPYVDVKEKRADGSEKKVMRMPAEFRKPVTVKKYMNISRDEIYEDRFH